MASGAILLHWLQDSYTTTLNNDEVWENVSWSSYHNLSNTKYDDFSIVTPFTITSPLGSLQILKDKALDLLIKSNKIHFTTSAGQLGLTTGLILAFILNLKFYKKSEVQHWLQEMILRTLFAAICLILALIAAPFVAVIMLLLICYHQGVHFFLKLTKHNYVKLFEGLDAIWAVEEDTARSIINVLIFMEVESIEQGNNLLHTFRKLVVDRLATPPLPCAKLFYLRRQCLGYFYWENQKDINIEDYIRPMASQYQSTNYSNIEFPNGMPEEILKNCVAEISNKTLPRDHGACWEVLVGSHPLADGKPNKQLRTALQYPIMFRIHHSLGDGLALMQLLVSVMTDDVKHKVLPKLPPMPIPTRKFINPSNETGNSDTIKSKILQTHEYCNVDANNFACRHQMQSPSDWNSCKARETSSKMHELNDNIKQYTHSKFNEISIDLDSIEENEVDMNNSSIEYEATHQSTSVSLESNTNIFSLLDKRQRPLLLKNGQESFSQQPTSKWQSPSNKYADSNHNPSPTSLHSQNFKDRQIELTVCPSKASASYYSFTGTPPPNFSHSLNSNFQTSLPILNLCHSPKNKFKSHNPPCITNPKNNVDFRNILTDSNQNTSFQSPTLPKVSLEEPPTLFNNQKEINPYPIPRNLNKIPKSSKPIPNQNTTVHYYNCSMSDSYITIPEELAYSSVETADKHNSTSTTIYYYSPATSPLTPDYHSENSNISGTAVTNGNNSLPQTTSISSLGRASLYCRKKDSVSEEHFSFEEINNSTEAAQFKTCNFSPTKNYNSLPMKSVVENSNASSESHMSWDNVSVNENRKTKSDSNLNRKAQTMASGLQIYSIANLYPDHNSWTNNSSVACDNVEIQTFSNILNVTNYKNGDSTLIKETQTSSSQQKEQNSQSQLGGLLVNWNKLWKNIRGIQNRYNENMLTKPDPNISNQYVELLNTISNSTTSLNIVDWFSQFIQTICTIALSPASLIHQILMKAKDKNILHGSPLSGFKVIAWHRDQTGNLFKSIKRVKHICNARFTEVFLSALSASLETYFETHQVSYNDRIPEVITVVIPARMEPIKPIATGKIINTTPIVRRNNGRQTESNAVPILYPEDYNTHKMSKVHSMPMTPNKTDMEEEEKLKGSTLLLNNRFSVAMLQLPISQVEDKLIKQSPKKRLNAVHYHSEQLRKSLDYQVNYWLLRVIATYLPEALLTAVVRSSQSTLVVSNVMGPTQELSFAGNKLRDIIFWVPHRGATGIGITVLSYMERLQIGIMADRALIHCKEDAQMILDELVVELCKLDAASTSSAGSTQ